MTSTCIRSIHSPTILLWMVCLAFGAAFPDKLLAKQRSIIIIDAGHGGKDKGSYWGGVRESRIALATAKELEKELRRRGFLTVMTRRTDAFVSLGERVRIANRVPKGIIVSVHYNANTDRSVKGIETYYMSPAGRKLASVMQGTMMEKVRSRNLGVKRKNLKVIRESKHPAILVECGFISNNWERGRANSAWYQKAIAKLMAEGVARYFGY